MSLLGFLVAGFLLGIRHALDPDHLAAVASITSGNQSARQRVTLGAVWGIGHTVTLLVIGGAAILLGDLVPQNLATWLEAAVGVMLVGLGIDILRRIRSQRLHVHAHTHVAHVKHLHLHGHRQGEAHEHAHAFPFRALFVGLMHGMAGSAALVLLALSATTKPIQGIAYLLLFGLGSVLGMALLSAVLSLPLRAVPEKFHRQLRAGVGMASVIVGVIVMRDIALGVW